MLDIRFYTANGKLSHSVEVAENFLEWLARSRSVSPGESPFSRIGKEKATKVVIDGDLHTLPLVKLGKSNRKMLIDFFNNAVVEETKTLLTVLGDEPLQIERTYRLRKLIELLDCLKNEEYEYLGRV